MIGKYIFYALLCAAVVAIIGAITGGGKKK
jgi:hypothetical protein